MGFLYNNKALDGEIKQIKQTIRLSMNGVTADSMKEHGISYKQNFGVSIIRLKEIAGRYGKKHDLAQRLWNLDIREMKILATMIQPTDSFTQELAMLWQKECYNIELKEQAIMNLYRNLPWAVEYSISIINSTDIQKQIFGWMLAGRITGAMQKVQIDNLLMHSMTGINLKEMNLCRSVATTLAALCRKNAETAYQIRDIVFGEKFSNDEEALLIKDLVKQELIFLDYVPEDF